MRNNLFFCFSVFLFFCLFDLFSVVFKKDCFDKKNNIISLKYKNYNKILFDIKFIKNTNKYCINAKFPAIKININQTINGWIQIVYSDAKDPKYKIFVDTTENLFPYYTKDQEFFDAPFWHIGVFFHPLSFWEAHTFAFIKKNKKIFVIGGIGWGFRLKVFNRTPIPIPPFLLGKMAWKKAKIFLYHQGVKDTLLP